jgi:[ribosomal protein S5]-alanine N-acetyltransferase
MWRRSRSSSVADALGRVETDRLVLRRPTLADLDEVARIHGDPAVWEHSPEQEPTWDRARSDASLRRWLDDWRQNGVGYWAIELDGRVVGFGGMMWLGSHRALNVYYRFEPAAWGNGYATEMVRAAVELARTHLPGSPLVIRARPSNVASIRVAERTGFERRPELDRDGLAGYALDWD